MAGLEGITQSYRDLHEALTGGMGLRLKDLSTFSEDPESLDKATHALIGQAAWSFLTETYEQVRTACSASEGTKIGICSDSIVDTEHMLKMALLYSDMAVVFSGYGASPGQGLLEGIDRGGVYLSWKMMWLRDLLRLYPAIKAGHLLSLPRCYHNASPGVRRTAWILGTELRPTAVDWPGKDSQLDPQSVYHDVVVPRSFGLLCSGADLPRWQSQLLSAAGNVREVAVQTVLSVELPYLRGADLATVCKVRDDNADLLGRFRRELQRRVLEARQLEGDQLTTGSLADRLRSEWLEDGVHKLDDRMRRESQKRWAARAGAVYATGSLVLSVLLHSPVPSLIAAGSGALLALAKGLIDMEELYAADKGELYALWQLKRAAKGKGRKRHRTKGEG